MNISDYLGGPAVDYYGGPVEDILGALTASKAVYPDAISTGLIIKPRSINPFKETDFVDFLKTTRSTDGDPADGVVSAISSGGKAVVTVNETSLGESAVHSIIYVVITVPSQFKGRYLASIALEATNKEGKTGDKEALRVLLDDNKDSIIPLVNFLSRSAAPQPINIEIAADKKLIVVVTGLPDEAVVSVVLPGPTDGIKLSYERWALSLKG